MRHLLRADVITLALSAAACVAEPCLAQNLQPSGLPARGAVQGTDVIVDQPAGSSTVQGALASAVATYVQQNGAPGTSGQVVLNSGGAFAGVTVSGDATLASSGALTVTKSNGTAFGTFAFQNYASLPAATGSPPISSSTVFPCMPSMVLDGCTAGQQANFTLKSIDTLGADPTGATDSTSAIQSAFTAGGRWTCNGVYKVSATLTMTAVASDGFVLDGGAAQGFGTSATTGRCVLQPTSAVSTVVDIDGTANSIYVLAVAFRNLTLNLTNAPTAVGFAQGQSFDIHYDGVRVEGGSLGECSRQFDAGALTTHLDDIAGMYACWAGNGTNNPTTQIFTNADIVNISGSQAGAISFVGGAIQPQYSSSMGVVYSAAPDTSRPTALVQTGNLYFYKAITLSNVDSVTFHGTFIGQNGGYPSTYSDGTHGTLSIYPTVYVPSTWTRVSITPAVLGGMYIYDAGTSTNQFQGNQGGGAPNNTVGAQTAFKSGAATYNGSNLATYSDNGQTRTSQVVGSTGTATYTSVTAQPATDSLALAIKTAAGTLAFQCYTNGTPNCAFVNGAGLYGFSDTGSTELWTITKGAFNGGQMQLLNSGGSVQLSLYGATGAITGTGTSNFAGYYVGATAGVTCSGTPTSSFAVTTGIVTHC